MLYQGEYQPEMRNVHTSEAIYISVMMIHIQALTQRVRHDVTVYSTNCFKSSVEKQDFTYSYVSGGVYPLFKPTLPSQGAGWQIPAVSPPVGSNRVAHHVPAQSCLTLFRTGGSL
jgi:hypothetical protein